MVGSFMKNWNGSSSNLPSLVAGRPIATNRPALRRSCIPRSKPANLAENTSDASTPPSVAGHDLDRLVRADRELGTELADERQAVLTDVDADHPVAERGRELDGVVAEAPGRADDRDGAARLHAVLAELLHRAVGGEPSAGERRLVVADVVGQLHQSGRVDRELLGEDAHHPLALSAVAGLAAQAVLAGAAPVAATGAAEAEDHPVPRGHEPLRARPERLDDADRLVADHRRLHPVPVASHQVEVRVADARRGDPHQRLVLGGNRDVDVLDPQRPVFDACSSHGVPV